MMDIMDEFLNGSAFARLQENVEDDWWLKLNEYT